MFNNVREGISKRNPEKLERDRTTKSFVTLFARRKLHCVLKYNYTHSKTHLKSCYVEKCPCSRNSAEDEKFLPWNRLLRNGHRGARGCRYGNVSSGFATHDENIGYAW